MSIQRQGQAAVAGERKIRRSGEKLPDFFLLGRQRTSDGLSQIFVKRYRRQSFSIFFFVFWDMVDADGSLDKAIRFFMLKAEKLFSANQKTKRRSLL